MSFVLRLPRKIYLCRSSSNLPILPSFLQLVKSRHVFLILRKVQNPLRLQRKISLERAKVVRICRAFSFVTSSCIRATSACAFQHLNFQKCSEAEVFCTFWFRNLLPAISACTFPTSHLPKAVLRAIWHALFQHPNFQKCSKESLF